MTISSTIRQSGPFIGNGSASLFPFSFKVFQASDLYVVKRTVSTGANAVLVLNSDYSVSLNQDQNSNPGGTVTLTAGALASGYALTITSDLPNLQPVDLTNQGGFYPDVINDALDRSTIQIQQIQDDLGRSLMFPVGDVPASTQLPGSSVLKGNVLYFNATTGNPEAGPSLGDVNAIVSNLEAINTVADDLTGADTIGTVATNISAVLAAPANAALAQDAVAYLQSYIDQVIMNITFPLDLGLVSDPVVTSQFDLGAI